MTGPEQPPEDSSKKVESLLASPELARAVESDEFKQFLDHLPVGIVISRANSHAQHIVYCNETYETLSGQTCSTISGKAWDALDTFHAEDDSGQTLGKAALEGDEFLGSFVAERDGAKTAVEAYTAMIENADGSENYRIVALVDVTGRDLAQRETYLKQIRDKDMLLKELQHRVKNNLQLVIALIRLESRSMRRGEQVDLDRLARRIEALAILYRALAEAPGVEQIDLGHYLSEIASALLHSHGVEGIRLELQVESCPIPVSVAMPAGLVVNELLTNSFKHAFDEGAAGTISVKCFRENDVCHVLVADDGKGMPTGMVWPMTGKISDLMVRSLRENAKADINYESAPGKGVRVSIRFEVPPSAKH